MKGNVAAATDKTGTLPSQSAESVREEPGTMAAVRDSASTKGLTNPPGENNCFLNCTIQVLWHLEAFRKNFTKFSQGHYCNGGNSCICCALQVIFTHYQFNESAALPPDALRHALAAAFREEQRFQLGVMEDAAECYEHILSRVHHHLTGRPTSDSPFARICDVPHCITHQKLGMNIRLQMDCTNCMESKTVTFEQMVCYISASALQQNEHRYEGSSGAFANVDSSVSASSRGMLSFGQRLKSAMDQRDALTCSKPACKRRQMRTIRRLCNHPEVVSIGLIWESSQPTKDQIRDVVKNIDHTIKLPDLFDYAEGKQNPNNFRLAGVVCYYGKHYSTFLYYPKRNEWVSCDDSAVMPVGPWESVVDKCCRGHYQPLLLLYVTAETTEIEVVAPLNNGMVLLKDQRFPRPQTARQRSTGNDIDSAWPQGALSTDTVSRESSSGKYRQSSAMHQNLQDNHPSAVDGNNASARKNFQTHHLYPNTFYASIPEGTTLRKDPRYSNHQTADIDYASNGYTDLTLRATTQRQSAPPAMDKRKVPPPPPPRRYSDASQEISSTNSAGKSQQANATSSRSGRTTPSVVSSLSEWIAEDHSISGEVNDYIDRKAVERIVQSRFPRPNSRLSYGPGPFDRGSCSSLNSVCSSLAAEPPTNIYCCSSEAKARYNSSLPVTALKKSEDPSGGGDRNSSSSTSSCLSAGGSSVGSNQDSGYRSSDCGASTCSTVSCQSAIYTENGRGDRVYVDFPGVGRIPIVADVGLAGPGGVGAGSEPDYRELPRNRKQRPVAPTRDSQTKLSIKSVDTTDASYRKLAADVEDTMLRSRACEQKGFLDEANQLCNRAIGFLQTALNDPCTSNDMLTDIHMKLNACKIHSNQMTKQLQSHSRSYPAMQGIQMRSKEETAKEILANRESMVKHHTAELSVNLLSTKVDDCGSVNNAVEAPSSVPRFAKMSYEDMLKKQLKQFVLMDNGRPSDDRTNGSCHTETLRSSMPDQREDDRTNWPNGHNLITSKFPVKLGTDTCYSASGTESQGTRDVSDIPESGVGLIVSKCSQNTSNDNFDSDSETLKSTSNRQSNGQTAAGNRCKKKTVRFSDNVSLVACSDDLPQRVDIVEYAQSYIQRNGAKLPTPPASNSSVFQGAAHASKSSVPIGEQFAPRTPNGESMSHPAPYVLASVFKLNVADARRLTSITGCELPEIDSSVSGTASECSDDDSESTMLSATGGKVKCSLCRKKLVFLPQTYCTDCSFYMSKLQKAT